MAKDEVSRGRPILWKPSKEDIAQARELGKVPDDVFIRALPMGSDIYSGTGLPENSIVLSASHLRRIRFPLHPLFHLVLNSLGLAPMQLNPNSYHMLSAFLGFGFKCGVSVGFADFFNFHYCATVRHEHEYFHFATRRGCLFFRNKPSFCKNWKKRPLLITGNWAAPEVSHIRIPSAFSVLPAFHANEKFNIILLAEERMNWLKENLAGKSWPIDLFSDDETLRGISCNRQSPVYWSYVPEIVNPNKSLTVKSLVDHIIDSDTHLRFSKDSKSRLESFHMKEIPTFVEAAESSWSSFERSSSEDVMVGVERELPLPIVPKQRRSDKQASDSQKHQKVDEPIDLTDIWNLADLGFRKIHEIKIDSQEVGMILQSLGRSLEKAVCAERDKCTSLEAKEKEHKECEVALDLWRGKTTDLEAKLRQAERERDKLTSDLEKSKESARKLEEELTAHQKVRESEYKKNCRQIDMERARNFRFGWVQASLEPHQRVTSGPDEIDELYEFEPGEYDFFHGMNPSDRP